MEINEAYKIMRLREKTSLKELRQSYLGFIRDFNPNTDREGIMGIDEAYLTLMTHLAPANESARSNNLTFKLGEFLQKAI